MEILKLKKIFFLIIIFISINSQTLADAKLFISKLTSDASKILASSYGKDQKMLNLISLAEKNVDIDGIGMYTLGKYRKNLSESDLNEYKSL